MCIPKGRYMVFRAAQVSTTPVIWTMNSLTESKPNSCTICGIFCAIATGMGILFDPDALKMIA